MLRRLGKYAVVYLNSYLSINFSKKDKIYYRRYIILALGEGKK